MESLAGEWGIDFCDECPFMAYDKKKKKYICVPNTLYLNKKDVDEQGRYIVPDWCGNKKIKNN